MSVWLSHVLVEAKIAATIPDLQWKQSSELSAHRFTLYISDFMFHNTVLVFTYEHAHNAIIGGRDVLIKGAC